MSLKLTNEGSSLISRWSHYRDLENVFSSETQGIVVAVRPKAQGIVVMREWKTELARAVCHEFFRVEECSEVRFSQLCKLLFLSLLLVFTLLLSFVAA